MPHPTSAPGIDLWLTFYQELTDPRLLDELRGLLSEAERQQAARFHFADDRKRYLATRALVRTVLSRYAPVAPTDWVFTANAYGRPQIDPCHGEAAGLHFNLSHTQGLIVLGVARHGALGVDVEHLHARQVSPGLGERFFSPAEAAALAAVPPAQRQARFFEYWTFKEAYIKARGMGLSIPLDRFGFDYPHEHAVQLTIDPALGDDAQRWQFWQFRPTPDHLLAICTERPPTPLPTPTLRRVVPTLADEVWPAMVMRESWVGY
ncbi:4'-phosphopantetheinyl transferase superfamily protein [Chitiniphilus purpureus]|uniref:4'-phosphopantetheinyl transferase superfamily protein n=1 Tax=Chitiniphilus purpureus TaxID=2981137 RepID=A0ABY6DPC2_9NEIS|nr:4'-phosphopantetheinyl transferase superfamily protein [Chitiniphilus sp. CD1]UXY16201.1 4'-phosphopantetheinyl transferase superfamily protein [Chitiniphilus sp. CD1]